MPEKKEILEYLRNRQKAAEIESKINGINLWVLLGAIALVSWQFISALSQEMVLDVEVALRFLLCAQCLYFINFTISGNIDNRDEVRFHRTGGMATDSAFNRIMLGVFLAIPPTISLVYVGWSFGAIILMGLALAFIAVGVEILLAFLKKPGIGPDKFPKAYIGSSSRGRLQTNLIMLLVICLVFGEQIFLIRAKLPQMSLEFAKVIALLVVLYLLVLAAVERQQRNASIDWTYELETELVLESIAPEVALRRIEHRALGRRLQDVMDGFFDEMDGNFAVLEAAIAVCAEQVDEARKIPVQYSVERSARLVEAGRIPKDLIEKIDDDGKEFSQYLKRLKEKSKDEGRPDVDLLLQNLVLRHEGYTERNKEMKSKLEMLLAQN
jgi:hypothetical protein